MHPPPKGLALPRALGFPQQVGLFLGKCTCFDRSVEGFFQTLGVFIGGIAHKGMSGLQQVCLFLGECTLFDRLGQHGGMGLLLGRLQRFYGDAECLGQEFCVVSLHAAKPPHTKQTFPSPPRFCGLGLPTCLGKAGLGEQGRCGEGQSADQGASEEPALPK